jgi:predicted amidophosphoribosyltransferase
MTRQRRRKHGAGAKDCTDGDRTDRSLEPRLPSHLQIELSSTSLEMARRELLTCNWRRAYEYAELAQEADVGAARDIMAEASAREAKRRALCGDFAGAQEWSHRAVVFKPGFGPYQERRRLVSRAAAAVFSERDGVLFEDTVGPSPGHWWHHDLLARVRGTEAGPAAVEQPLIMDAIVRDGLEDLYAVGVYQPWHVPGRTPIFTQYLRQLKAHGGTIWHAAVLLRQGLTVETDWIEDVDVLVPTPTAMMSYEEREFELTERLTSDLGDLLCVPVVDAFERAPDGGRTRLAGGYSERKQLLQKVLRVTKTHSSLLRDASAVLIIDDVVTYGTTFEVSARKLKQIYPHLRVYGAALAYTQTPERREKALAERE